MNLAAVRAALPVHAGSSLTGQTRDQIEMAVVHAIGRKPTDVSEVCCDTLGKTTIYIGLPGRSYRPFAYNLAPAGKDRLPQDIIDLDKRTTNAVVAAIRAGSGSVTEDDSQGYAVINDPAAKAMQMQMRTWALAHGPELLRVVRYSSDVDQRRVASEVLGYAQNSPQQIAALQVAAADPDSIVRNHASRALMILLHWRPDLAQQLDPLRFIAMLSSGIWTDRNQAIGLLEPMSQARDAKLLALLRARALQPLMEMAEWNTTSHAYGARLVLGRIAGIPEGDLRRMAQSGQVQAIVDAVRKR
jgi:hypothetical protein